MKDRVIVADYTVLAASLDLNDAITKFIEDNDKNVAAILSALARYTDSIEAAPSKDLLPKEKK